MAIAIIIENDIHTTSLVKSILNGEFPQINSLITKETSIFSIHEIEKFIEEEEVHEFKILTKNTAQSLKSMSNGERKKRLLEHLLSIDFKTLILVNPYDNLDQETQSALQVQFEKLAQEKKLIQVLSRSTDIISATDKVYQFKNGSLLELNIKDKNKQLEALTITEEIPGSITPTLYNLETLVHFKNINVSFSGKQVLKDINWLINKGEFWQLKGPNGSGKSTLLQMITGDSHKGYGQDLILFGHKKGSGESVWDIKRMVGYFTPAMVDSFKGYHTVEQMLISGLHDSVGLYQKPSEIEKSLANRWLNLLKLDVKKEKYFNQLSQGEKRLVMTARAMIKHPPLLILDEPTIGLDDASALFFVRLVNAYARESTSTIIFVSHRDEKGLQPKHIFKLTPTHCGSLGKVHQKREDI